MSDYKSRLKKETWRRVIHITFHISSAFMVMQFYSTWLKIAYWIFCALFFLADLYRINEGKFINRLVRILFGEVIRKWEFKRLSSATFTMIALSIVLIFFRKEYVALAFVYQGLADPFSSFIRAYSSRLKIPGVKALDGTIGFLLIIIFLTYIFSLIYPDFFETKNFLVVALIGGGAGAIAEAVSVKSLDDNLSVPIATCLGLWLFSFLW